MEIFQDFYWWIIQRLEMEFINLVCWVKVLMLRLSITVYIYGLVEHQFGLLCWAMTFLVLFLFAKGTNSFHLFLQIPICSYLMFYRHSWKVLQFSYLFLLFLFISWSTTFITLVLLEGYINPSPRHQFFLFCCRYSWEQI